MRLFRDRTIGKKSSVIAYVKITMVKGAVHSVCRCNSLHYLKLFKVKLKRNSCMDILYWFKQKYDRHSAQDILK